MAENNPAGQKKKIVILGGSYGGISVAHNTLKHVLPRLPDKDAFQVIVISASAQVICRPACPRALISDDMFPQQKLFVDIPKAFEQYPAGVFEFVHGKVKHLDHNERTVTVDLESGGSHQIPFYVLVIATGASTPSPLMSLNRDASYLRSSWATFRDALPAAHSILIAGGGPAGVETAGELGEYLNGRPGWFSSQLANPKVPITVLTAGSQILPALRPAIATKAEAYLAAVGVTVVKNARVTSVSPTDAGTAEVATKTTLTLEDGTTLDADIYIPTTGTRPNTEFIDQKLLSSDGRVITNASTLRVDIAGPRIYAIGDVASYARPAIHLILEAVPVLCANLRRDLLLASGAEGNSAGEDRIYKEDVRETQMVPIGKSKGVGAAMGYQLPSFLIWLIKGRDYWLWTTENLWSGKHWAKAF